MSDVSFEEAEKIYDSMNEAGQDIPGENGDAQRTEMIAQLRFRIDELIKARPVDNRTEVLRKALVDIATTFPTALGINGNALTGSADFIKMRNNHMTIAQNALEQFDLLWV